MLANFIPHQAHVVGQPGEAGLALVRLGPAEPLAREGHHLLGLGLPLVLVPALGVPLGLGSLYPLLIKEH